MKPLLHRIATYELPTYPRRVSRTQAETQRLYRDRLKRGVWPGDVELSDDLLRELVAQGHLSEDEAHDPDARARALGYVLEELTGL